MWIALAAGLAATLFWDSELLTPIRLFIVLIHEFWHGLGALVSGAVLQQVRIDFDESGETFVRGLTTGAGFALTVSAGYIGAALTGAILLSRGIAGQWERVTLGAFSIVVLYMSYLFTEPGSPAFYTGIGWGLGTLCLCLLGRAFARVTLLTLGSIALWYCLYDLLDFTRELQRTDAGIFARYIQAQDWPLGRALSLQQLAGSISLIWSAIVVLAIVMTLRPVLFPPRQFLPAESPPTPLEKAFPGEITPPVQEWLLSNGFGLDGKPLPAELLESPSPEPLSSASPSPTAAKIE